LRLTPVIKHYSRPIKQHTGATSHGVRRKAEVGFEPDFRSRQTEGNEENEGSRTSSRMGGAKTVKAMRAQFLAALFSSFPSVTETLVTVTHVGDNSVRVVCDNVAANS
jgi:hypothetical protein